MELPSAALAGVGILSLSFVAQVSRWGAWMRREGRRVSAALHPTSAFELSYFRSCSEALSALAGRGPGGQGSTHEQATTARIEKLTSG